LLVVRRLFETVGKVREDSGGFAMLGPMSNQSDISQSWANAQRHLPRGWKIDELREGGRRFTPTSVVPQALARHVERPRVDNAGDPCTAIAIGPDGQRVEKRGADAHDALERLTWTVERAAKKQD
jgi:hypothetical protein